MAWYLWFQGVNSLFSVIDSAFHWSDKWIRFCGWLHPYWNLFYSFVENKNKAFAQCTNILQSSSRVEENRQRIIYTQTGIRAI